MLCIALPQAALGHTHNDPLLLRTFDCMPRNSGGDYQVFTVPGKEACRQQNCQLFLPQMLWNKNVLSINVVELKQGERKPCEIVFLAYFFTCLHVLWRVIYICKRGSVFVFLASILVVLSTSVMSSSRK